MFEKTLLAAAALSFMALGATSPAHATYGNGHHNKHRYNFSYNAYPWLNNYSYKSYVYQPSCYYERRPVTLKLWDNYSYSFYFKTIYRDVKVCY